MRLGVCQRRRTAAHENRSEEVEERKDGREEDWKKNRSSQWRVASEENLSRIGKCMEILDLPATILERFFGTQISAFHNNGKFIARLLI